MASAEEGSKKLSGNIHNKLIYTREGTRRPGLAEHLLSTHFMLLVVSQVFYLDLGLGLAHRTYCMHRVLRHALWFGAESARSRGNRNSWCVKNW